MTPELWNRLNPLFSEAIDRPISERRAYVADVCGDDAELQRELLALIDAHERQSSITGPIAAEMRHVIAEDTAHLLVPGDMVMDRFKILAHVGGGGMGNVYKALDTELHQCVALKMIRPEIATNDAIVTRFKREVHLARRLSGPNLCRIHELFLLKDSRGVNTSAFLTMEFLDGITLADKLQAGPLPWRQAQPIALDICAALGAMHRAGIVHRDVKSRNIMLANRDGATRAVLMDFGLARELTQPGPDADTGLTTPGVPMGTVAYMAPEQFAGAETTPATDVYALGIVLYELVTGKNPFAGSNLVGAAILRGLKPNPAASIVHGLPQRWDRAIRKCIENDPALRYQSADEVARALRPGLPDLHIQKPRPATWIGMAAIAVLLIGLWSTPPVRERLQGLVLSEREKHIVVLPFDVSGNSPDFALITDGFMESLTGKLSNLNPEDKSLWVVPASEVRRRNVADPYSAYQQFGATMVVKGRFSRIGNDLRLNLELIDARRLREIGYATIENPAYDLAALENETLASLGRLINVPARLETAAQQEAGVSSSAYQDYIAALGYMQRFDKPGNLDGAIQILNRAIGASPRFAEALSQLCHAYTLKYQIQLDPEVLASAQQTCDKAIRADNRIAGTYSSLASLHRITGRNELAEQEYQRVIDLDPNNVAAVQGMAHIYEAQGRRADAERAFQRVVDLRPQDWLGYNELGNFYDRTGRHPDAMATLQRAVQVTPDNAYAISNLASAYLNSGDPTLFPKIENDFKKSIAISPSYQAYAGLGNLYGLQQKFKEAAAETEKALQLDDHDYAVWTNLMEAYEGVPDPRNAARARDQAIPRAERAIATNPNNADAHAELAGLLARTGRRDDALEHIRSALAIAPKDLNVLWEVADAYEVRGDRVLAIRYLQQALANGYTALQINGDPVLQRISADPRFHSKQK